MWYKIRCSKYVQYFHFKGLTTAGLTDHNIGYEAVSLLSNYYYVIHITIPVDGRILGWRVKLRDTSQDVEHKCIFQVWRPVPGSAGTHFTLVYLSDTYTFRYVYSSH